MKIRKYILWKVPAFCIVAGVIAFQVAIYLLGRFGFVTLPDGTFTPDNTRMLIIYGAIFIGTLFVGGIFFFRNMTRKEIFYSASIVVVLGLIMDLTQWVFNLTTGPGAIFFLYASRIFDWSIFVDLIMNRVSGNIWFGAFIGSLTPFLFIPFGKKKQL